MPPRSFTKPLVFAGTAALILGGALPIAAAASPNPGSPLSVVAGGRVLKGQTVLGQAPASMAVSGELALAPRDPAGLAAAATAASTPGNVKYHHFLAAGAFGSTWGPTTVTREAAVHSLEAAGLAASTSANGLIVSFHGSASQVSHAFHAPLSAVRSAAGRLSVAASSPLRLPQAVSANSVGVFGLGLSTPLSSMIQHGHAVYAPAIRARSMSSGSPSSGPLACGAARQTAVAYDGQTDDQLATRYGANQLFAQGSLGQSQRVAIFELEPFAMSDVQTFVNCYLGSDGVSQLSTRLVVHNVAGGQPAGPGSGEAALDIENIAALAPQAGLDVYQAPNTTDGALLEYNQIVQDDADKLISSSWGLCEPVALSAEPGAMQLENAIFEQAALQGQTVFAAAGDAGSSDCQPGAGGLAVDDPASQPYVVSVGGTTIEGPSGIERVWNDGASWGGGGGGISQVWAAPSWQVRAWRTSSFQAPSAASGVAAGQGLGNDGSFCATNLPSFSAGACRGAPDVSANADEFTGAITIYQGGWTTIGGTSSAAPIWAALMADVASSPTCVSQPFGFLSPSLYAIGSGPTAASNCSDVTAGGSDVFSENSGLYSASGGYDLASGLGSPKITGLATTLCTSHPFAPVVSSLSPSTIDAAGNVSLTVHGAHFILGMVVQVGTLHFDVAVPTSPTSLSVTVPAASLQGPLGTGSDPAGPNQLGPGRYQVIVSSTDGSSVPSASSILDLAVTSGGNALPAITGVLPSGGTESGGQQIALIGNDFAVGDSVSIGGVAATGVSVTGPTQLTAVVPAFVDGTTQCAATGTDPSTDVCQASVVVTGPDGSSIPAGMLKPSTSYDSTTGALSAPAGCGCESVPAPSEFDYFPPPQIDSITSTDPTGDVGEGGGTAVIVHGRGFGTFAMTAAVLGDPTSADSYFTAFTPISPTELAVTIPALPGGSTVEEVTAELRVETMASSNASDLTTSAPGHEPSNPGDLIYAGVPKVRTISSRLGPVTGGRALTLGGLGLRPVQVALFGSIPTSAQEVGFVSVAQLHTTDDSSVTFAAPSSLPGPTAVMACTVSGCSNPKATLTYVFYPLGAASITSLSRTHSSARGGDLLTITGTNLSCGVAVHFVGVATVPVHLVPALTGCGSSTMLKVRVPAAWRGASARVQVLTAQGLGDAMGYTLPFKRFTYTWGR